MLGHKLIWGEKSMQADRWRPRRVQKLETQRDVVQEADSVHGEGLQKREERMKGGCLRRTKSSGTRLPAPFLGLFFSRRFPRSPYRPCSPSCPVERIHVVFSTSLWWGKGRLFMRDPLLPCSLGDHLSVTEPRKA